MDGELVFNVDGVSVLQDEKVLELDGCTAFCVNFTSLNCTLRNG